MSPAQTSRIPAGIERPVLFTAEGNELCGIVHVPELGRGVLPEYGIVFAHSGSRGRLGNTMHYPYLARALCKQGHACLRFDPSGIGDSSGDIGTDNAHAYYHSIQRGRYVPDTLAAIAELERQARPRHLLVLGVCGGAMTALLTAAECRRVEGAVLLSVPVLLDNADQDDSQRMPRAYARNYLWALYARKLLSPRAWLRLFTLKSDLGRIYTYGRAALFGTGSSNHQAAVPAPSVALAPAGPPAALTAAARQVRFNPLFGQALDRLMERKAQVLFLFGTADPFWIEFQRDFYTPRWNSDPRYAAQCQIETIADCNHMFTLREWQDAALAKISPWLAGQAPALASAA